jgi:hypothetical protein
VTEPRRSVPRKAQEAFRLMLQDPSIDLQKAALAVGTSTYNLRRLLKLPHVAKWARAERSAIISELCAGNMAAIRDIRDRGENQMARVAAVRAAENLRAQDMVESGQLAGTQLPGMRIVITVKGDDDRIERTLGAPMIEHDPIEAELEPAAR